MQLFYEPEFNPPRHILGPDESQHCIRVLRMTAGDTLHITDGRGNMYLCRIVSADRRRCEVEVLEHMPGYGRLPYRLAVAVAPTKNQERFEWFVEKATEIGVTDIIPLETERCQRRTLKHDRLTKVAAAAMKQSLKAYCPEVHPVTKFNELAARPFDGRKLIAHCDESSDVPRRHMMSAVAAGENILILIGPEGDFSPEEIKFAAANGFRPVTLGNQRLRTETAGVVAAVLAAAANDIARPLSEQE